MSARTNGTTPAYVLREEFEELDGRVDSTIVDIRRANAGILRIEAAQKRQTTMLSEHSQSLADISAVVMRVEARLAQHEETLEEVEDKAERAERNSGTNEHLLDFTLKVANQTVARSEDSIRAKRDWRRAALDFLGKGSTWLFGGSVAAATLILSLVAKSCGVELPAP